MIVAPRGLLPLLLFCLIFMSMGKSGYADETVTVFAAGSLREAFTEIAAASGEKIAFTFGPAGLLRERIEKGAAADLFASANMTHPQALADKGRDGPVTRFTRNALCAITLPGAGFTTDNLIARMLDPKVKLGIFTPGADPSGDYALVVFGRVDALRPGAGKILEAKARPLLGGRAAPQAPAGQNPIAYHLKAGDADLFLGYCTIGKGAGGHLFQTVALPDAISVAADYGMIVLHEGAASRLAQFILSDQGQAILAKFGFVPL
ncbi:MAG TPA: substrate-binding domain-containing protein [Stellaceae bacterium]|nr:substrate-binding domain-containing protein [Stellaceae bacterium]